jgi:gliding motility-associated-like protein
MQKTYTILLGFLLFAAGLHAQTPTVQDCLGAIPICQNVYSTTASYSGEGNYPNEINSGSSCLGSGELNDVWYTFTVQQSGNLNFSITPNNSSDDYDWAVYNLTNATCAQIFTNPGLEVSCNFSATPGNTGPTGASTLNSQPASGTPFNAVVPVIVGQTYVVNVSNFSSSQNGYTINFGASTAVIFDQVPPVLTGVNNPGCGSNQLVVTFSENILCNTVQSADFTITGPGGPYTVTSVTSPVCAAGGTYTNTYTITISPAITNAGNFTANLVGPVTDLCGNVAIFPASQPFVIGSFTFTTAATGATCAATNGTASVNVTGPGPFTYTWSPNVSTTNSATGLASGTYTVTILDQGTGCSSTDTIVVQQNNTLTSTVSPNDTICPGGQATLSITLPNASPPVVYSWSNGLPNQATQTVSPAVTTTYTVSAIDGQGCSAGPFSITITVPGALSVTASTSAASVCAGSPVTLSATGNGGTAPYSYNWMPGSLVGASVSASPTASTTYTVTITDDCGQTSTAQVSVAAIPLPVVSFIADTTFGCSPLAVQFTITSGSYPAGSTYFWDFDDGGPTSTALNPAHNFTTPGCHDVSLTVTVPPGCSATQTYPCMINTYPQPVAAFTATPTFTSILNPTINFTNQSTGVTTWLWDFDDNSTSTAWSPSHTYDLPNTYNVMLAVSNDSGCVDTAYLAVRVLDFHTFWVPNAFTPDGTGLNDTWGPVFSNILEENYLVLIYDRWGNKVFESNKPGENWNGTFRNNGGEIVQQDVYVYRIVYTDNLYEKHELIGSITVVK